jgi:hypothetical protein
MEGEHMETLARRYHLDVPDPSPAFRVEVAALFADVAHRPQDPDNLFRIAIALERRAAAYFTEHADAARPKVRRAARCSASWRPRSRNTPPRWPPSCERWRRAGRACSAPARRRWRRRKTGSSTPPRCCCRATTPARGTGLRRRSS